MDLKNKNILVTGAAGFGIGFGVAKVLANLGARVLIHGRSLDKASAASKKIPNSIPIAANISNSREITLMFIELADKVGIIHGLVNNAGIGLSKEAHQVAEQEFDNLYAIDVKAVWLLSKLFARQLIKNNVGGNIVNISSVHTYSTISKYAVYASAKSAVEGLTKGMAVELGRHNIRVNAIAPGYVHAEQNFKLIESFTDDPKEWVNRHTSDYQSLPFEINSEDCGHVVGFLLSDLSRIVTGQVIYTDNGTTSLLYSNSFTEQRKNHCY